jgi:hypothetical protein
MMRETGNGVQVFRHAGIALTAGDAARLEFGDWTTAAEGIPLVTTQAGHRSTETLSDQASG